jgi:hypothetical protein
MPQPQVVITIINKDRDRAFKILIRRSFHAISRVDGAYIITGEELC